MFLTNPINEAFTVYGYDKDYPVIYENISLMEQFIFSDKYKGLIFNEEEKNFMENEINNFIESLQKEVDKTKNTKDFQEKFRKVINILEFVMFIIAICLAIGGVFALAKITLITGIILTILESFSLGSIISEKQSIIKLYEIKSGLEKIKKNNKLDSKIEERIDMMMRGIENMIESSKR